MLTDRLKQLRKENDYTQLSVAKGIGVDEAQYRRFEIGKTKDPRMSSLIALADFFNVPLDYLVGRSDDPKRR